MQTSASTFTMRAIATFHGSAARKYDAPRQGVFAEGEGVVEFVGGENFEQALRDLDGFERVWILFVFDRNEGAWRTTTRPPVPPADHDRVGTFASRSPYRPNPIGLTCARLLRVEGRRVFVAETDLLDGTAVLDVKPYIPSADAFPNARVGWMETADVAPWSVEAAPVFSEQAAAILSWGGPDLLATARVQLAHAPLDSSRKRVQAHEDGTGGVLSLRMFRLHFRIDCEARSVYLTRIASGYSADDLLAGEDPYEDKDLHRRFVQRWPDAVCSASH